MVRLPLQPEWTVEVTTPPMPTDSYGDTTRDARADVVDHHLPEDIRRGLEDERYLGQLKRLRAQYMRVDPESIIMNHDE